MQNTTGTGVYVSLVVMILAAILPRFGLNIGNDAITTMIQTLVVICVGIYASLKHGNVVAKANGVS